ncbi:MAG: T9SS type A sorting domain-containing protein [Bacteroidetes bacterium]|nr:T9SS type A sorting domain-containing protein [Bacteroidota bacterium]
MGSNIFVKKKFLVLIHIFIFISVVFPQKKIGEFRLTSSASSYSKFNINQISTFLYNDGSADVNNYGNSGFVYPKGSMRWAVYESGFLWGGKVNGQIRTGGSSYRTGLKPGKILDNGTAEDPNSPDVRVFRVRRDYANADLSMETADEGKSPQEIYDQYKKDWNEWPVSKGAPFEDVDGDGKYDPTVDHPGVPGADQTLWFVANDLDSNQTKYLYGALPFGIEMQTTIWGYAGSAPIGNIIFKRYLLINKSKNDFKEMYIGIWSDPDLGDAGDDYVGCDTTLDLGYVYNARSKDAVYNPLNPPSVGFCLLEGPIIEGNSNDVAQFMNRGIKGKRNLPMTAFCNIYKSGPGVWHEPFQGDYQGGTIFLYNLLQGLLGDGTPHPVPKDLGGGTTKFPYSGDPVKGTGFLGSSVAFPEAPYWSLPSDKKLMVCSGPFNMAPGDTQEIIFAQVAGGAVDGIDYLSAIMYMKTYAAFVRTIFNDDGKPFICYAVPNVSATALDNQIVLNWGKDTNRTKQIENGNYFYGFQGYNVYQFPLITSKFSEGKLIATFDKIDGIGKILDYLYDPVGGTLLQRVSKFGSDSGVQRFFSITKDYLRNEPLANGNDYCFGVTQYSYTDKAVTPRTQESGFKMIRIKPQAPPPGVRYTYNYGDSIPTSHVSGSSAAEVNAFVVDPTKLNGHNYEVTFKNVSNKILFSLFDIDANQTVVDNQTNLHGDNDYSVTDGFILKVKNSSSNHLTERDVYQFKTFAPVYSQKLAQSDVESINVFPNPYYGANRMETNKYEKIVTFTHLPQRATIRIFNLAGQLVRTLEKNSPDEFLRWDLLNELRYQAPSGLYIVYIELPDIGKTKILKLAIVQEQTVVDWF